MVLALSGAAHLAAVLLLTRVRSDPYTPPPPFDVVLAPADSAPRPTLPRQRRPEDPRSAVRQGRAEPPPVAPPAFTPAAPSAPAAPDPAAAAAAPSAAAAGDVRADAQALLGAVLQQRFDCDRSPSAHERERCVQARGAAARGTPPVPLLSRKQKDAFDAVRPPGSPTVEVGMLDIPGGALGLPPPIGIRVRAPRGKPPKAINPIAPSTLRGDDDALRPRGP